MLTNYCKRGGLISVCEMTGNPIGQENCEFSEPATPLNRTKDKYCMHLGKIIKNHCDCAGAQNAAKYDEKKEPAAISRE